MGNEKWESRNGKVEMGNAESMTLQVCSDFRQNAWLHFLCCGLFVFYGRSPSFFC